MQVTLVIVEVMLWGGLSLCLWAMLTSVRRQRSSAHRPHMALKASEPAPRRAGRTERRTAA